MKTPKPTDSSRYWDTILGMIYGITITYYKGVLFTFISGTIIVSIWWFLDEIRRKK